MAQHGIQVHLLCLDDTCNGSDHERTLVDILNLMKPSLKLSSKDRNQYFPSGCANDYSRAKIFVNVCFITPVPIAGENVKWDDVSRNGLTYGRIVTRFNKRDHALCLRAWGVQQLESIESDLENLMEKWKGLFPQQDNSPENNNPGSDKDVNELADRFGKIAVRD